jgi:hypothetical protein
VKKASQTKALPQLPAVHRRGEKAGRKSSGEIDGSIRQHVSFPI